MSAVSAPRARWGSPNRPMARAASPSAAVTTSNAAAPSRSPDQKRSARCGPRRWWISSHVSTSTWSVVSKDSSVLSARFADASLASPRSAAAYHADVSTNSVTRGVESGFARTQPPRRDTGPCSWRHRRHPSLRGRTPRFATRLAAPSRTRQPRRGGGCTAARKKPAANTGANARVVASMVLLVDPGGERRNPPGAMFTCETATSRPSSARSGGRRRSDARRAGRRAPGERRSRTRRRSPRRPARRGPAARRAGPRRGAGWP